LIWQGLAASADHHGGSEQPVTARMGAPLRVPDRSARWCLLLLLARPAGRRGPLGI